MKIYLYQLLLLSFFWASSFDASAQVTYDNSMEFDYFEGFLSTDNFLYTYTGIQKEYGKGELTLFDHSGRVVNTLILEGKARPTIEYTGKTGAFTVFALDKEKYLFVDEAGKEARQTSFEGEHKVKNERMVFFNNGFAVVQQVKVKKVGVGLRVRGYDSNGTEQWSYEKFPEKGRYDFDVCSAQEDGSIGIVYSKGGMTYEKGFLLLSNSGAEVGMGDLALTHEQLRNTEMRKAPGGGWFYTGDFGNSNEGLSGPQGVTTGNPLGMAIVKIDGSTGKQVSEKLVDFKEIQVRAGDRSPSGGPMHAANPPILQILDIVSLNGQDYFLCESVLASVKTITDPNSSSEAPMKISFDRLILMDFYLLECTRPMSNPTRIWKQERVLEIKRKGSFSDQYSARKSLLANNAFSYQGMVDGKLLVRGFAHMHHYFTLIDIEQGMEDLTDKTYWSLPIGSQNNVHPPTYVSYGSGLGSFATDYFSREGLVQVGNGFLLYAYDYRSNQLQLAKLTF